MEGDELVERGDTGVGPASACNARSAAAKQRRQRSLGLSGTLLLFMLVLALVFFWSGSVR